VHPGCRAVFFIFSLTAGDSVADGASVTAGDGSGEESRGSFPLLESRLASRLASCGVGDDTPSPHTEQDSTSGDTLSPHADPFSPPLLGSPDFDPFPAMMLERDAPLYMDALYNGNEGGDGGEGGERGEGGEGRVGGKDGMGLSEVSTQPLDSSLVEELSGVAQASILDQLMMEDDELMCHLRAS